MYTSYKRAKKHGSRKCFEKLSWCMLGRPALWLSQGHHRGSDTVKTLFGTLNNARYTWYIVFGGKRGHGRSTSDNIIPTHCAQVDEEDKANRKLYRQITKYQHATVSIWLSLERQQHSTERCHSTFFTACMILAWVDQRWNAMSIHRFLSDCS